jgi:hypothetical protein
MDKTVRRRVPLHSSFKVVSAWGYDGDVKKGKIM